LRIPIVSTPPALINLTSLAPFDSPLGSPNVNVNVNFKYPTSPHPFPSLHLVDKAIAM
jgi:hypothetical protein